MTKEKIFEDSKNKLIKNKRLMNLSKIIHFGAELSYIPAMLIPTVNGNFDINELATYFIGATALNIACQPVAFYLKAKSMTSEGNYELAQKLAKEYEEEKDKISMRAIAKKQLSKFHFYFAKRNNLEVSK
ncbi:MAG: hypothetical protein WC438_01560 [Candidatus Pacearchaeota archaeon]